MTQDAPPLRCSFCNKSQRDVKKLIAGPAVYICDECIDICNEVLEEGGIPAGRGPKAAVRAIAHAEEYLRMAADLTNAGNYAGAAREIRNAALAVLRGLALADGDAATQWSETKVVLNALESDPGIARLLHVDDATHVLLRVSIEGATFTRDDVERAAGVTKTLIATLQEKVEASETRRPKS